MDGALRPLIFPLNCNTLLFQMDASAPDASISTTSPDCAYSQHSSSVFYCAMEIFGGF